MKRSGAWLIRYALEQVGVRYTFGIPGVHVTELYDELNNSDQITPVLVTHEGGGAFMAEGFSRTSDSIGTLVVVPAAGLTHAMSGVGEAFLDGIPMLVIAGSTRRDTGFSYQLHQLDQQRLMEPLTKKTYLVVEHKDIVPMIYEAYRHAVSGEPGPVFVEIPVEVQLFRGDVGNLQTYQPLITEKAVEMESIDQAVELLKTAKHPAIFAGWGARDATQALISLAESLGAPVATSLQGLSVFPASHALHAGMSFGKAAVPAAQNAFKDCDCLLAVGVRFGEIGTGSYSIDVPENLIHIDINPEVFDKNYAAKQAIQGDATVILNHLIGKLADIRHDTRRHGVEAQIKADKAAYHQEWLQHDAKDRVNPQVFFDALSDALDDDAFLVVDDGNHTFLAAELFPVQKAKHFISPTDFNCMGYAVPAAIGVKLGNPGHQVAAIVGDGAFMMTCMEIVTAASLNLGVIYFVFNDGELSQISQGQEIPYNRKTCTVLGKVNYEGVALATGAELVLLNNNQAAAQAIEQAMQASKQGHPVVVDVHIDYSKRSQFTQGIVKANLGRFPLKEKIRFISRALTRKVTG